MSWEVAQLSMDTLHLLSSTVSSACLDGLTGQACFAAVARDRDRGQDARNARGQRLQPDGGPPRWRHPAAHAPADRAAVRAGTHSFLDGGVPPAAK